MLYSKSYNSPFYSTAVFLYFKTLTMNTTPYFTCKRACSNTLDADVPRKTRKLNLPSSFRSTPITHDRLKRKRQGDEFALEPVKIPKLENHAGVNKHGSVSGITLEDIKPFHTQEAATQDLGKKKEEHNTETELASPPASPSSSFPFFAQGLASDSEDEACADGDDDDDDDDDEIYTEQDDGLLNIAFFRKLAHPNRRCGHILHAENMRWDTSLGSGETTWGRCKGEFSGFKMRGDMER
jgi:hypothetical protein